MLYYVLHQPVLVDLHLSISFEPCSSGSALLQQEAENTTFSFFFALVQRYLHPTSRTAGVKQNRNRLWGQRRVCDVGHKTQQDAAVVQRCGTEEPVQPHLMLQHPPEQVSQQVLVFYTGHIGCHEKRQVVLL